jgi:hypothetical protein
MLKELLQLWQAWTLGKHLPKAKKVNKNQQGF